MEACGNGRLDPGEACDDGNMTACDGCTAMCQVERCGNGVQECAETCDDGNTVSGDGCSATCMFEPDVCGNGVVEMGEVCDAGALNDDVFALEVEAGAMSFIPDPVSRSTAAQFFYGLVSASAHTGYEDLETSNLFLYRDLNTGVVSLFAVHGIDRTTTGIRQPLATVIFQYSGVPSGVSVVISDDGGELRNVGSGLFRGDWNFQDNTDGGVLSGFPIPGTWTARVDPTFLRGIRTFRWVDDPNRFRTLPMSSDVIIRAQSTPAPCRTDCTVPTCGDGIWDAGEACDDGNTVGGDGCAADCRSVR